MADENIATGSAEAGPAGAARPKVKMVAYPGPVDEFFVDGVGGVITRGGVVKLDLFRVVGFDRENNTELRQVCHRLVLPAAAVPDLVTLFQSVVRAAQRQGQGQIPGQGAGEGPPVTSPLVDPMV